VRAADRRSADRRSPVIRLADPADATTSFQLREPIRIQADGTVTMNFERIGIPDFVRAIFGEVLNLDYTMNPNLAGAISLQVSRPVPREAVFPIAERALAAVGIIVRRDGDLVVIEPDPRGPAPGGPVIAVSVRRLQHVDTAQMEQALQPFVTADARVSGGPLPDSLILSGSADGVDALENLVDALDIDPLSDRSFALFPLMTASASQVAEELRLILGVHEQSGADVIEIERMNAVLVVTPGRRGIEEAQFWVRKLDQSETLGTQIHVYQVQNRRAPELALLLQNALAGGEVSGLGASPAGLAPGLTPISVGEPGAEAEPAALAVSPAASRASQFDSVTVIADEGTNSIMTIATPDRYAIVEAALRQLDIQPVQVLIEATIIEVTLNDRLEYGVRWFFEAGDTSFSLSEFPSGAISEVFPGFNFVLDSSDVRAVVSALDSVSDVEIVSAPSLMVLNNETARLEVGDEIPIVTRTAIGVGAGDAPITNEIERRQTGVILEITPRVNASGLVLLDIMQEVSNVSGTDVSGFTPIAQRRFESSVLLRDRETIALGGLVRNSQSDGKTGIPILSDIPVLGALFGATNLRADRTELLVVIRPIVVRNHSEARAAYEELRSKLRGLGDLSVYLPSN
jgi:general secretion pathway protein D